MSTPYCIVVFTILNIRVVTAGVIRSTQGTSGSQSRTGILVKLHLFENITELSAVVISFRCMGREPTDSMIIKFRKYK